MSVRTHCGTVTIPSGSTTTINYTSCPFTPKAGIFLGGLSGSQAWNTYQSYVDLQFNLAFVDDDAHQITHHIVQRNNGEYQDYGFIGALTRHTAPASGSQDGLASHAGWTSSGYDLSISDAFPEDYKFAFILFGGAGFDAAEIVSWADTGGGAGDRDITGVGFQGNLVFLMDRSENNKVGNMFGFASGSSNNACLMNSVGHRWCGSSRCIVKFNPDLGYINNRGKLTTWLSDGFRLNYASQGGWGTNYAMVFKTAQGKVLVENLTTRMDGNDITESGWAWGPTGAVFLGGMTGDSTDSDEGASAGTYGTLGFFDQVGNRYGLGWYWGSREWAMYNNELYVDCQGAVVGLMDFKSRAPDGFTNVMDDPDPGAYWVGYAAVGPPGSPARGGGIVVG